MTVSGHDVGRVCACVADHRPAPLELTGHHILPLYLGGGNERANLIWLCPTTHYNVHELIRVMMRDGRLTWSEVLHAYEPRVSRYAFTLAHEALNRHTVRRGGRT